jgi:hypothetical protein
LPPFVLTGLLWFIAGHALTFIFKRTENKFVFRIWKVFFLLNILAILANLILIRSVAGSWYILILAITALGFGIYTIYHRYHIASKPKSLDNNWNGYTGSVGHTFLLIGNYNTGKILMTGGIYTVLVGYLLINAFRLSNNIYVFSEYFKESEEEKHLDSLKNRPDKISLLSFSVCS